MTYGPYSRNSLPPAANRSTVLIVSLLAFLIVQYQRQHWPFQDCSNSVLPAPIIEPDPTVPDDQSESATKLKDSYLVVVEETQGRPASRIKVLNDYEFWFSLRDRGLKGFRILDPDSPEAKSFLEAAANRSIKHPFVMHVSSRGKVQSVIPFPTTVNAIEEILE